MHRETRNKFKSNNKSLIFGLNSREIARSGETTKYLNTSHHSYPWYTDLHYILAENSRLNWQYTQNGKNIALYVNNRTKQSLSSCKVWVQILFGSLSSHLKWLAFDLHGWQTPSVLYCWLPSCSRPKLPCIFTEQKSWTLYWLFHHCRHQQTHTIVARICNVYHHHSL